MSDTDKLKALGYESNPSEIRRFQRDFNRMKPARLIAVTGTIDADTKAAIGMAYVGRKAWALVLGQGGR